MGTYRVRAGDTLSRIARAHGVALGDLLRVNPQVTDPDRIFVDQVLTIPDASTPRVGPAPAPAPDRDPRPTSTGGRHRDWTEVPAAARMAHVVHRLARAYGMPVHGAAGVVGNLVAESGVLPNRIEGSRSATPMRAEDFTGRTVDFSARAIMERDRSARRGPRLPGVGLAQWTAPTRRAGLFRHVFQGRPPGPDVLFDMDAQVDYLVAELRRSYAAVDRQLRDRDVTVHAAADEVVYSFEVPGAILDGDGRRLPRDHPRVREVFAKRRALADDALAAHRAARPVG